MQIIENAMINSENRLETSSRKTAIKNGEIKYLGSSCKKGHNGLRWTSSGICIDCHKEKYKATYVSTGKKGRKSCEKRLEAKRKGEIYYYSEKPCLRGHYAKRRTATGSCQKCHDTSYKANGRDYTLRTKYKITLKEYNELLAKQHGVCLICKKEESAKDKFTKEIKTLSVDHCHNTGKVRGLLCHACNVGIGLFKHNVKFLQAASLYCEES